MEEDDHDYPYSIFDRPIWDGPQYPASSQYELSDRDINSSSKNYIEEAHECTLEKDEEGEADDAEEDVDIMIVSDMLKKGIFRDTCEVGRQPHASCAGPVSSSSLNTRVILSEVQNRCPVSLVPKHPPAKSQCSRQSTKENTQSRHTRFPSTPIMSTQRISAPVPSRVTVKPGGRTKAKSVKSDPVSRWHALQSTRQKDKLYFEGLRKGSSLTSL